jgi:4-amino-4-deoxy-L-arabinose transferase-like glycosyltransferase
MQSTSKRSLAADPPLILTVSGLGTALLGQGVLGSGRSEFALLLFIVATFLVLWAVRRLDLTTGPFRAQLTQARGWPKGRTAALGLLLLVLAVVPGLAALAEMDPAGERASGSAWLLYALSLVVMLVAAQVLDAGLDHRSERSDEPSSARQPVAIGAAWMGHLLVVVTLTAALAVRIYRLGEVPFGLWYDEAQAGLNALLVLTEKEYWPLFDRLIDSMGHYILLIAGSFRLFGADTESLRLVSALMGTATAGAAVLVGRELFGWSFAWVPAFLVAFSRWNITVSRLGMHNASTPLFQLLALGFLLRGLRRRSHLDVALAGTFLGLGLCFYVAFWLFLPALGVFLTVVVVGHKEDRRSLLAGVAVSIVATALVVAPVAHFAYNKPEQYFHRVNQAAIFGGVEPGQTQEEMTKSVGKHLLMFNVRGDRNGRHNLPGEPMLDPISGALMVTGLGICLARVRKPLLGFLPLWWGCALAAGVFSLAFEAPQSLRAVGAQPAASLLAALPLYVLWRAARRFGDGRALLLLLVVLLPVGWLNVYGYFERQAKSPQVWKAHSLAETLAAQRLLDLGPDTVAYVTSFIRGHPTLEFLIHDQHRNYRVLESHDSLPRAWPAGKNVVLLVSELSEPLRAQARRLYPGGQVREFGSPFGGSPALYEIRLSKETLRSAAGLQATFWPGTGWEGEAVLQRRDSQVEHDWRQNTPVPVPFSAEWRGVLRIEEYGHHEFALQSPGLAELYLDESLLVQGKGLIEASRTLARGNHSFRLRLSLGKDELGRLRLSWRPPKADAMEVLPSEVLFSSPVTGNGLLASFYPNDRWAEPALLEETHSRMDLYFHLLPLDLPFSVEWLGEIHVPMRGRYGFRLESRDESSLEIDGQELIRAARSGGQEQAVVLDAGLHDIRILFAARTSHIYLNLSWQPPGGSWEPVPTEALFPRSR